MVNDGQTVVLGGILETDGVTPRTRCRCSWISRPRYLFKTTTTSDNKDELLIFVTPKILREGSNIF